MTNDEELAEPEEEGAPSPPPHGRIPPEGEARPEAEEVSSPPPHGRIPAQEEPGTEQGPSTEEKPRTPSLADLDIYDTLRFLIGVLNQAAWIHLGLVVAPGASEARTDLAQARVAIDSLEALASQLRPVADPTEEREIDNVLANLRVNYVKKAE
jgi:hypothetical protein